MARTTNIIDISHHQAEPIDFAAIKASGVVAVIHKASQGTGYVDPRYRPRIQRAHDAGLLWGAYHFLNSAAPDLQAKNFLEAVFGEPDENGDYKPLPYPIALAADYEDNDQSTPTVFQCYQFMRTVETRAPGDFSVILYSGNRIKETLRRPRGGFQSEQMIGIQDFFSNHRLWLAQYGPKTRVPWPWAKDEKEEIELAPWLWQFTDKGKVAGIKGNVDCNYFAGGVETLKDNWQ